VEILGRPALLKRGDYYEAYISVRNSGRGTVAVHGLEVEGGQCIIEAGANIKPGESVVIGVRCSINPDPGTSVVKRSIIDEPRPLFNNPCISVTVCFIRGLYSWVGDLRKLRQKLGGVLLAEVPITVTPSPPSGIGDVANKLLTL
jgi:hypothetical protein